ncbi:hypothetical protein Pelo_18595 [Pelomyxa schiedti]|nr:hypothetical protein Pelo_18595 [Pelomyxa schiedti]
MGFVLCGNCGSTSISGSLLALALECLLLNFQWEVHLASSSGALLNGGIPLKTNGVLGGVDGIQVNTFATPYEIYPRTVRGNSWLPSFAIMHIKVPFHLVKIAQTSAELQLGESLSTFGSNEQIKCSFYAPRKAIPSVTSSKGDNFFCESVLTSDLTGLAKNTPPMLSFPECFLPNRFTPLACIESIPGTP